MKPATVVLDDIEQQLAAFEGQESSSDEEEQRQEPAKEPVAVKEVVPETKTDKVEPMDTTDTNEIETVVEPAPVVNKDDSAKKEESEPLTKVEAGGEKKAVAVTSPTTTDSSDDEDDFKGFEPSVGRQRQLCFVR